MSLEAAAPGPFRPLYADSPDPLLQAADEARRLLGSRAWCRLRRVRPHPRAPEVKVCEIGVKNPEGAFEFRASGPSWPAAVAHLIERLEKAKEATDG